MLLSYTDARKYFRERYGIEYTLVSLRRLVMLGHIPIVKPFNGRVFIKSEDIDKIIEKAYIPASAGPLATEPVAGAHHG